MTQTDLQLLADLRKALEGGQTGGAFDQQTQGAAIQREDCSPELVNVCYQDRSLFLTKLLAERKVQGQLVTYTRELSYGDLGYSAQAEGAVGDEHTGAWVKEMVPICFYSHVRRHTLVSTLVQTIDGVSGEERQSSHGAKKIAADLEFDYFRGKCDFSNGGVFDGEPSVIGVSPNMIGIDVQIRQADRQIQTQDLMMNEYGADGSVVFPGGGGLTQTMVDRARTRAEMNHGQPDTLLVDPTVLESYNEQTYNLQRIILAGAPQETIGAKLGEQWTPNGKVEVKASRFLAGKTQPARVRPKSPAAPASVTAASATAAGITTQFTSGEKYMYFVTATNEAGEGPYAKLAALVTVATTGDVLQLTITHPASTIFRAFNVYRSEVNPSAGTDLTKTKCRFVGRVAVRNGAGTTVFTDQNLFLPGSITGYMLEFDTMHKYTLMPYSKIKLAAADLSTPEAHAIFTSVAVERPRANVVITSLRGPVF